MDMARNSVTASEKLGVASVASTRANSPVGSSTASDDIECSTPSCQQSGSGFTHADVEKMGVVGLRRGIRASILKDLGVDLQSEDAMHTPTTVAGSPCRSQFSHMPATPSSVVCSSPSGITSTRPPILPAGATVAAPTTPVVGDASQRIATPVAGGKAARAGLGLGDASQRSPIVASSRLGETNQRSLVLSSPGLPPRPSSGDASLRTPPQRMHTGTLLSPLSPTPRVGDASQRSPASRSYALSAGTWGAAAASIAATRNAAADDNQNVASQLVPGNPSRVPASQDQGPATPTGSVAVHATDSLKCWLSGVSGKSMPSADELAARLRAAQPDCYDD